MTAINTFVDDQTAYLVADGAVFTPDGTILFLMAKTLLLAEIRMAIGISGRAAPADLFPHMSKVITEPTQAAFLRGLPEALRLMWCATTKTPGSPSEAICLWIAMYDEARHAPRLLMLSTSKWPSFPKQRPFELYEYGDGLCTPPIDLAPICPDGWIDNPRRDSRAILRAQRKVRWNEIDPTFDGFAGRHFVGGECDLVCVSAAGITVETILRFPDHVGGTCDPDEIGVDVVQMPTPVTS